MLLSLPVEAIEQVVAFVTAQESLGGPPPGLYALMQTCQYLHYLLAPEHSPGTFYRLFRDQFDHAAPQRRLPHLPLDPTQFGAEARRRFSSLKLIRGREFDNPEMLQALLTAYVMILEDDGKNSGHLRWAGLGSFLKAYFKRCNPAGDLDEASSLAVILQSQWFHSDALSAESEEERDAMLTVLDPYLFGQHHPDADSDCDVGDLRSFKLESRPPSQLQTVIPYFGHSLSIVIPASCAPYAILSYVLRVERYCLANPQNVPSTRSERTSFGPTREDFDHYNAACRAHTQFDPSSPASTSSQYDVDWARLMYRSVRFPPGTYVRPFKMGDLSGFWDGTLLLPSNPVEIGSNNLKGSLGPVDYLSRQPIAFELREHYHCTTLLSPAVCCEEMLGIDSILSTPYECALNLPGRRHKGATYLYSDRVHDASPACNCDRLPRRVDLIDSAVSEVYLTGVTPASFGEAWGSYRFTGKVRMSDGLVILRRVPVRNGPRFLEAASGEVDEEAQVGFGAATPAWLFGYVLGSHQLVGRWHVGSLQNVAPSWEGVFGLWKSMT